MKLRDDEEFKEWMRTFYKDKKSEAKESYNPKPLSYRAKIQSHLQEQALHSNGDKNIRYIQVSNGAMMPYVPIKEELEHETRVKRENRIGGGALLPKLTFNKSHEPFTYTIEDELTNSFKLKLHNPDNQVKRNRSVFFDNSNNNNNNNSYDNEDD